MNNENENASWDLTVAASGEMETDPLKELSSDPEFLEYLNQRCAEALEYQMAHEESDHLPY